MKESFLSGSVRLILHPVEQNHAGKYVCLLSGFNSNHIAINTTQEVRLKVTPKNTSAAGESFSETCE